MIKDPLEVEVQLENVALKDPKVLLERLVKWDLLEAVLKLEHVVKKGDTGGVGQQGPIGPQGSTGPRGAQGANGLRGVAGIQGPLGVQGPISSTIGQGERGLKRDKGFQGSVGANGNRGERGERGVTGEKDIQGDNSDVLSVLAIICRFNWLSCLVRKCALSCTMYQKISRVSWNYLVWERYVVSARTTNPPGILLLNFSMVKGMKWQTYRKRLVLVIS